MTLSNRRKMTREVRKWRANRALQHTIKTGETRAEWIADYQHLERTGKGSLTYSFGANAGIRFEPKGQGAAQ